jgi:hypothetical protein
MIYLIELISNHVQNTKSVGLWVSAVQLRKKNKAEQAGACATKRHQRFAIAG